MTVNTSRLAKEQQRSTFLLVCQSVALPACKSVERSLGKNQGKLKFGDCLAEHIKSDWTAVSHRGEKLAEPFPVLSDVIDPSQYLIANVEIVARKTKPRHLNSFSRRNERLCNQQVR